MKLDATLSRKFLLFWGGSTLFVLILVGGTFLFFLGQYHQTAADVALAKSFKQVDTQLRLRDQRLGNIVLGLARNRDVVSVVNLLNKYQDKENYQPLIFDAEKKKLARRLLDQETLDDSSYIAIYTQDLDLVAFSRRTGAFAGDSGILSYRKGAPFYLARKGTGEFSPLSKLPPIGAETAPAEIPDALENAYRLSSGTLIQTVATPILRKHAGAPDEMIGVVVAANVLGDAFVEQTSQFIGHSLSLHIPGLRTSPPPGSFQPIAANGLPNIFATPGAFLPFSDKNYFSGAAEIRTSLGKKAAFLIGVDKRTFVSTIEALQESIMWVLAIVAVTIFPLGAYFIRLNLTAPIGKLMSGVDALSRQEAGAAIDLDSRDELGVLARSFNHMALTIHAREKDLRARHDQLRHERSRVEKYLDIAEAVIVEIDVSGSVVLINRLGCDLLGFPEDEIVGKDWFDTFVPEEKREEVRAVHAAMVSGEIESAEHFENDVVTKSGEHRFLAWHNVAQRDDGGTIVGVLSSGQDITERMAAEAAFRQSQKMEALGQLTGGVGHDFNNLLQILSGNIELMRSLDNVDGKIEGYLDRLESATNRGSSLTHRLLAFSRQQALSPTPTNVNGLVVGLKDMLQRTLGETVEFETVLIPNPWMAMIDADQFEHALVNLAVNARDAMPDGGNLMIETANVTLDAAYADRHDEVTPGDYVRISVTDTGEGMTPDVLDHVFEPFFTTKEIGKGSGLGMSMVYGFVKQSRGHISIYSEVGKGTTVNTYLPRTGQVSERNAGGMDEGQELLSGHERILLVEDDPMVREVSVELLKNQGYEIVEAGSGAEALRRMRDGPPFDLLFTDLVLPGGMNGKRVADEAQRLQPGIRVLYATGYSENAVIHNGRLDKGVNLLNKPYMRKELLAKVRAIIDGEK